MKNSENMRDIFTSLLASRKEMRICKFNTINEHLKRILYRPKYSESLV